MAKSFADIIVDIQHSRLDRRFQYKIPEALSGEISVGSCVSVPFGNRTVEGYVIGLSEKAELEEEKIKEIRGLSKKRRSAEENLITLAIRIRQTYGSTIQRAIRTVLPYAGMQKAKKEIRYSLAVTRQEALQRKESFMQKHFSAKVRLLTALLEAGTADGAHGSVSDAVLRKQYNITLPVIRSLEKEGLISKEEERLWRDPQLLMEQESFGSALPDMSKEQSEAYAQIDQLWETTPQTPVLLHGITGSGKTRIYLELAKRTLEQGKSVIILIPEISLSRQTVQRFYEAFGGIVSVLHSRLGQSERFDQIEKVKRGDVRIMIGPRSALFTPFSNLGLIIIDEEHEGTYQNEEMPRYDTRAAARMRCEIDGASLLLGSATPSIDSYRLAECGIYRLIRLNTRFGAAKLPQVSIVDMREELREGNRSILSRLLKEQLTQVLARHEQALLFLNKRGYSGFVSCRSCGHVIKCPHCDISLTLHRNGEMICHYCGHRQAAVKQCPECGSVHISGMRAGTEQIEALVKKEFPNARVLRMDADTTTGKNAHNEILKEFSNEEADILIGTQMIVKGHDFPHVTLVGILMADLSLFASNYRAAERTFGLLVQCIGRAGRGDLPGKALIQTYQPDNYSIRGAATQDYLQFYHQEKSAREWMDYPPFGHLLAIRASIKEEQKLATVMEYIRRFLASRNMVKNGSCTLIGPAPEPVSKLKEYYRAVLYVKASELSMITYLRGQLEQYIELNKGFADVLISYDIDL